MEDWKPNWYHLASLATLVEGQGAAALAGSVALVVHRHGGEVVAARDGCPRCASGLAGARCTGDAGALLCPGCGAALPLETQASGAGIGVPVMLVDEDVFGYVEAARGDGG